MLYALFIPWVHAARTAQLSLLDITIVTLDEMEKLSSSLRNFHLPSPFRSAQRPPIYQQHFSIQLASRRFITRISQPQPTRYPPPITMKQQPLVGHGLLIIQASRSHSDTPHCARLFWTSDQPGAETCTWPHTALTRKIHLFSWQDSNPQSHQTNQIT
jgi:hypothetical protein